MPSNKKFLVLPTSLGYPPPLSGFITIMIIIWIFATKYCILVISSQSTGISHNVIHSDDKNMLENLERKSSISGNIACENYGA